MGRGKESTKRQTFARPSIAGTNLSAHFYSIIFLNLIYLLHYLKESPPYLIIERNSTGHVVKAKGMSVVILEEIAKSLDFTYLNLRPSAVSTVIQLCFII